jgi:precorrin-6B methylase 2
MQLSDALADVDAAAAKLLGSYEEEIADVFVRAIEDGTSTFVDVGCADGYYAVGMACAAATLTTHAFDIAASARRLCRQTAALNGVTDRVDVRGRCDADELARLHLDRALVLIDIEGAEAAFLDGEVPRLLARSRLVIEVHEDQAPGTGDVLVARFARTHTARRIDQASRAPSGHLTLAGLSHADALLALSEHRGPQLYWLVLTPRRDDGATG